MGLLVGHLDGLGFSLGGEDFVGKRSRSVELGELILKVRILSIRGA